MLGKSQIWVETQPSAQSPFKKLNFTNSSPKSRKNGYQTFLDLSSFTGFLYLVPNFLSRILDTKFQLTPTVLIFFDQICPKRVSPDKKGKFGLARASMVVIFYIKLFRTGANRHTGIIMSLLLLVAETVSINYMYFFVDVSYCRLVN